jgi:hypothetical protein
MYAPFAVAHRVTKQWAPHHHDTLIHTATLLHTSTTHTHTHTHTHIHTHTTSLTHTHTHTHARTHAHTHTHTHTPLHSHAAVECRGDGPRVTLCHVVLWRVEGSSCDQRRCRERRYRGCARQRRQRQGARLHFAHHVRIGLKWWCQRQQRAAWCARFARCRRCARIGSVVNKRGAPGCCAAR